MSHALAAVDPARGLGTGIGGAAQAGDPPGTGFGRKTSKVHAASFLLADSRHRCCRLQCKRRSRSQNAGERSMGRLWECGTSNSLPLPQDRRTASAGAAGSGVSYPAPRSASAQVVPRRVHACGSSEPLAEGRCGELPGRFRPGLQRCLLCGNPKARGDELPAHRLPITSVVGRFGPLRLRDLQQWRGSRSSQIRPGLRCRSRYPGGRPPVVAIGTEMFRACAWSYYARNREQVKAKRRERYARQKAQATMAA
jgi:hypothetical protein